MPEGEDLHRHGLRSSNKKPQLTKALEQSREGDELVMRRWRSSTTFGGRINSKVSAQHFQFSTRGPLVLLHSFLNRPASLQLISPVRTLAPTTKS